MKKIILKLILFHLLDFNKTSFKVRFIKYKNKYGKE